MHPHGLRQILERPEKLLNRIPRRGERLVLPVHFRYDLVGHGIAHATGDERGISRLSKLLRSHSARSRFWISFASRAHTASPWTLQDGR